MRDGFIFYNSFYESIKELEPKDQVVIYNAICEYEFYKKEPELTGICKSIFTLILPQLKANDKRYENGKKGGRPKNQKETKTKPKNNQNKTKLEPKEKDKEKEKDKDIYNSSSSYNNNIYDFVEKNFGRILTPLEIDKIDGWKLEFSQDIIEYAIQISVLGNKKTFNYVNGILNNWKSKGYKTLQEIKDNDFVKEEEPQNEIFDYDWLNEEE